MQWETKKGSELYLINWFGMLFLVNNQLKYVPDNCFLKGARIRNISEWSALITRSHWFPQYTPKNLTTEERYAAKGIARRLKRDPLHGLTSAQMLHVIEVIQKRAEHEKWMSAKAEEFKERYKSYTSGTPPVPLILLIQLSGMYTGDLASIYKKIDTFHKENIEGKRTTMKLMFKERKFLEALEKEVEADAEAEHMASI